MTTTKNVQNNLEGEKKSIVMESRFGINKKNVNVFVILFVFFCIRRLFSLSLLISNAEFSTGELKTLIDHCIPIEIIP